jgi:hypothetical protein
MMEQRLMSRRLSVLPDAAASGPWPDATVGGARALGTPLHDDQHRAVEDE